MISGVTEFRVGDRVNDQRVDTRDASYLISGVTECRVGGRIHGQRVDTRDASYLITRMLDYTHVGSHACWIARMLDCTDDVTQQWWNPIASSSTIDCPNLRSFLGFGLGSALGLGLGLGLRSSHRTKHVGKMFFARTDGMSPCICCCCCTFDRICAVAAPPAPPPSGAVLREACRASSSM